jgi:O-antigen/teichoic acid export membrane protein
LESNNKRIAKNTLMLYFRMFLVMGVALYTSRIVLNVLGVSDYGVYNIVGGVVVLVSFINNAMSSATQRFLNFEIGKKNFEQLKKVFSASLNVHILISIIVIFLAETFGLWFVNSQLNIPQGRMLATNFVYQFTILTFVISIIQVPYNAAIIAHEQMSFYAYISIIEALLKLGVVFILKNIHFDKLELYGLLICLVAIIVLFIYIVHCHKKYQSTHYVFVKDTSLYKELLGFSGWSVFGGIANVGKTQVVNILINIFCGVTINAAMAIANQVSSAINGFVSNFQIAFNPQIVKLYATNEKDNLFNLVFKTSKYSYFLLYILSLPVILNIHHILKIWLKIVPNYTAEFCQLTIIYMLVETISGPLWMLVQATGNIKKYQIIISSILLLNIPVSYFILKSGMPPYFVIIGTIFIGIIALFFRISFLRFLIEFSSKNFFKKVMGSIMLVSIITFSVSYFISAIIVKNYFGTAFSIICSMIIATSAIYIIGMDLDEKNSIVRYLHTILFKKNKQV